MVKALIISYNALPMDVVSSYRTKAYCDHLFSFGVRPTLVTHRWEKTDNGFQHHREQDAVTIEETEHCTIIRLPYPGTRRSPSALKTFWSYITGNLDVEVVASYKIFKRYLWDHLQHNSYDVLIAIYNPHFHLKLAYECLRKFKIPYVLDFRDLWDNDVVTPSYRPHYKKRVIDLIVQHWWKKWIGHSLFFVTTGERWRDFLSKLSKRNGFVVRNGWDYVPETAPSSLSRAKPFKVIHFGRMYRNQVPDVFLSGFMSFADDLSPEEARVEIIGLKRTEGVDFESTIRNSLNEYVTVLPYMSREKLIRYCRIEAALFFFPSFKEDNGQFPVKLYDYCMMGKNILVSPGGGEVSEFVRDTNTGVVLSQAHEVTDYLHRTYRLFKEGGSVPFNANQVQLNRYSRRSQVEIMANAILSSLRQNHE